MVDDEGAKDNSGEIKTDVDDKTVSDDQLKRRMDGDKEINAL